MTTTHRFSTAPLVLAFVIGCDSTETGSGPAATSGADVAAMCDAQCARDGRCPHPDVTIPPFDQCKASCIAKVGTNDAYRADAMNVLRDCYVGLACGESDDQCLATAVALVAAAPQTDPLYLSCNSRQDACASDGVSDFSDDRCITQFIFSDSAKNAFSSCLELPCEQISACSDSAVGRTR